MHMHTLHNKLSKPESLWSGVCLLIEPFPALLLWKRDVFLHFWKCPISPINYYFYCNHPSILWVTNCIIAPTLPNCSDFETTKMLFWKYRSKKNKRMCSTPLTDLLCLHIWLPDMLLFKAVVSHSKTVLSYSVLWLSLWFAVTICNIFSCIFYICLFTDYLSSNTICERQGHQWT
jgi:dolichyl-phosphate-mannose--protein O-mannosyl transferase